MNQVIKAPSAEISWKMGPVLLAVLAGSMVASLQMMNPLYLLLAVAGVAVLALALDPWKGVILMLLASQANFYRFEYGAFTVRPEQMIFVLAAGAWVILVFARRKAILYSTILDKAIWALLITGLLSSFLNSPVPRAGYQGVALQLIYVSMYFFTVNVLLNNRSKIDSVVKLLMAVAALHAFYALIALGSFLGGVFIGGVSKAHVIVSGYPSTMGLLFEPNLFGAFVAAMTMVFAAHLVTQGKQKIMKNRFLVMGFAVLFVATITSMTRGAWIGIIVAMPALIFCAKPRWNVINPRGVTLLLEIIALFIIIVPFANYALSSQGKTDALIGRMDDIVNLESGTATGRLETGRLAIDEWKDHPIIGRGVMSLRVGERRGWLYSTFSQSLHDTGLVGLGLTLWIHLAPVFYALWASTKTRNNIRKASLIGLALGAVVMAVASQSSSFFWLGFPWIYLGVLVAMAKITIDEDKAARAAVPAGQAG